jgi:hypothetical protein
MKTRPFVVSAGGKESEAVYSVGGGYNLNLARLQKGGRFKYYQYSQLLLL